MTCCAALKTAAGGVEGGGRIAVALKEGIVVIGDLKVDIKEPIIRMDSVMGEDGSEELIVMDRNHSLYKIDCQSGVIVGEYSSEKMSGTHYLPDFQLLRPSEMLTGQYIGHVSFLTVNSIRPFMKQLHMITL